MFVKARAPDVTWPLLFALVGAALAGWIGMSVLEGAPHVPDESAYLWQADTLRHGSLTAPPPRLGAQVPFTLSDGVVAFGIFPNGWPAVLALFGLVLPYSLVNPLLFGLLIWRGAALARRVAGDAAVLPAAALIALSPQLVLLAGSLMSHTLVALLWVIAWELGLALAGSGAGRRHAIALGAAVGLCFLTRPLCGMLLGLSLLSAVPLRRWGWLAAPLALALGLQLAQNQALTGDALRYPVDLYFEINAPDRPGCNHLGIGADRGCDPLLASGYGLTEAAANTWHNLRAWSWLLLGPGLLPLPLLALYWADLRRQASLWIVTCALVVTAYGLYWYGGTCYGARFYHGVAPLMLILAGAGLSRLGSRRWLLLVGVQALQLWTLGRAALELPDYWGVDARFARLVARWSEAPAVVLVQTEDAPRPPLIYPLTGPEHPLWSNGDAPSYLAHSSSWPDAPVWFGAATKENLSRAAATGRVPWLYELHADPSRDTLTRLKLTQSGD